MDWAVFLYKPTSMEKGDITWARLLPTPQVMGILNVTPDSFSDGGRSISHTLAAADRMRADGAAIIDVGGESTRPGASPVSPEEEQHRVLPIVAALARDGACVSVDTRHGTTMARALDAGAAIINDVSGLLFDPVAARVVAEYRCLAVLMHMRGTPETMDGLAHYGDVVGEVRAELGQTVQHAVDAGVARNRIAIDPGFGFAKTNAQGTDLLRGLSSFLNLSCPIIAGLSRKRMVGELGQVSNPGDRDAASLAAGLFAVGQGASVLRVHDVRSTVQALRVWTGLTGASRQG